MSSWYAISLSPFFRGKTAATRYHHQYSPESGLWDIAGLWLLPARRDAIHAGPVRLLKSADHLKWVGCAVGPFPRGVARAGSLLSSTRIVQAAVLQPIFIAMPCPPAGLFWWYRNVHDSPDLSNR